MEENQEEFILKRDNKNYLHIKEVLDEVESKELKIDVIQDFLIIRQEIYFLNKYFGDINIDSYIKAINEEDLLVFKGRRIINDYSNGKAKVNIEIEKQMTDNYIEFIHPLKKFKIKVSKIRDIISKREALLEVSLHSSLEEILENVKIAKNFYNENKYDIDDKNDLFFIEEIKEIINKLIKNKREIYILINDKLVDLFFIIDCLILKLKQKEIKKSLENYYRNNYTMNKKFEKINLSYIENNYYKRLEKDAKQIINILKEYYKFTLTTNSTK
jgi:hypothetical protein